MRSKTGVLVTIGKAQVRVSGFGVGMLVSICECGASGDSFRSFWTGVVPLMVASSGHFNARVYASIWDDTMDGRPVWGRVGGAGGELVLGQCGIGQVLVRFGQEWYRCWLCRRCVSMRGFIRVVRCWRWMEGLCGGELGGAKGELVLEQAVWEKFSIVLDRGGTVVVDAVVPSWDVSPMQLVGVADGKD